MSSPVIRVGPFTPVRDVASILADGDRRAVLVVDETGAPLGTITVADLAVALERWPLPSGEQPARPQRQLLGRRPAGPGWARGTPSVVRPETHLPDPHREGPRAARSTTREPAR
jgi:hypothetical protein